MAILGSTFKVPYEDSILDQDGMISRPWTLFFRMIRDLLDPLGSEKTFELENNQAIAEKIKGFSFRKEAVSQAIVDYLIQRVTTGTGGVEYCLSGQLFITYLPKSETWTLFNVPATTNSTGITFSISSSGEVLYTSSNIAGTPSLSRVTVRARVLGSKSKTYSQVGGR